MFKSLSAIGWAILVFTRVTGLVLAAPSDSAIIPISASLDEVLVFTVHDPLSFSLLPSPWDTQSASGNLEIATNAEGGYSVSISIDRQLTEEGDENPDVIPAWTGTINQMKVWPANLAGFGFSLDQGQTYAGVPASQTVIFSSGQTNGQTVPVHYQVTADSSLDAGVYSATLTYTAVANF